MKFFWLNFLYTYVSCLSLSSKNYLNIQPSQINYEGWLRISRPGKPLINPFYGSQIPNAPTTKDSFYFRLVKNHLHYTQTKYDMAVVGSLSIQAIQDFNPLCEKVMGERVNWILCAQDIDQKNMLVATLSEIAPIFSERNHKSRFKERKDDISILTKSDDLSTRNETSQRNKKLKQSTPNTLVKEVRVQNVIEDQPIWMFSTPTPQCNQDWNYKFHGADWTCKCAEGSMQSPVSIKRKYAKIRSVIVPAIFDFPTVSTEALSISLSSNWLKLACDEQKVNNCQNVILGSIIDTDGTEYLAYELIFHFPNEHSIDEEVFEMEIQIIYKAVSEGDFRKKAGLAFLIKETPGAKNLFLSKMDVLRIPEGPNQRINLGNNFARNLSFGDLFKSQENDIMESSNFNYFSYVGSLTTPPCDEPVKWFVVEKPVQMGLADLEILKKSVMKTLESGSKEVLEDIEGWKDQEEIRRKDGNFRQEREIAERWIEHYNKGNNANTFTSLKEFLI